MSKKICLIITFSVIITFIFGQDNAKIDSLKIELENAIHDTSRVNVLNQLALITLNDSSSTIAYCQESIDISEKIGYTKGEALATYYLGSTHLLNISYNKAIFYYKKSLPKFELLQNNFRMMKAYLNIGAAYFHLGHRDSSILNFELSLEKCRQIKDTTHLLMNLENLATLYIEKKDEYQASRLINEALQYKSIPKYAKGKANLLLVQGNVYLSTGDLTKALEFYQEGLELAEEHNDSSFIALFSYNVGFVHDKMYNNQEALKYFKKALEVNTLLKDNSRIIESLNAISIVYMNEGNDTMALESIQKAFAIAKETGNEVKKGSVYFYFGDYYESHEEFDSALIYYNKALQSRKKLKLEPEMASCYSRIADVYVQTNKYHLALLNVNKAYEIQKESSRMDQLVKSLEQLSDINYALKDYKRAYEYHVKYHQVKDSIYSDESIKKITSMELQFNFDKEREIAKIEQHKKEELFQAKLDKQKIIRNSLFGGIGFLIIVVFFIFSLYQLKQKNNRILKDKNELIEGKNKEIEIHRLNILEQNVELKELVKTRDKYISVLAHDLKGIVGGSTSLIELLEENGKDWENRDSFIEQLFKNNKKTYDLLTHVVAWGKASLRKESVTPEKIQLFNVIENIKNLYELQLSQKSISFNNLCESDQTIWFDPNMIDAVFRNLIQNAIKYSKNNGIITIDVKSNEEETEICVSDTGVGMSKEKATNLFTMDGTISEPGTAGEKGTGLGLQIIKEYIAMHGGEIWVESEREELDTGKAGETKVFFTLKNKITS